VTSGVAVAGLVASLSLGPFDAGVMLSTHRTAETRQQGGPVRRGLPFPLSSLLPAVGVRPAQCGWAMGLSYSLSGREIRSPAWGETEKGWTWWLALLLDSWGCVLGCSVGHVVALSWSPARPAEALHGCCIWAQNLGQAAVGRQGGRPAPSGSSRAAVVQGGA
jgi:hypothetical protein